MSYCLRNIHFTKRGTQMAEIFISFSFSDEMFAIELSKLLKKISKDDKIVYCVAENNNYNAVKYGEDFSEDFLKNVKECTIFIPLLSTNYLSSISSIIEFGVALGNDKIILPLLLPESDYQNFNNVYNLRNRDFYGIDDQKKFKKFLSMIREELNIIKYEESDVIDFFCNINEMKKNYFLNIANQSQCVLICEDINTESESKAFENKIIKEKLVETIVCQKVSGKVKKYHLYMYPGKTISDLKYFLEKNEYKKYNIAKLG